MLYFLGVNFGASEWGIGIVDGIFMNAFDSSVYGG